MQIERKLLIQQDTQITESVGSLKNFTVDAVVVYNRPSDAEEGHYHAFGDTHSQFVPTTPVNEYV